MEEQKKNPWLGLESYKEGEVLYGRDDDIRDLTQSVLNDTDTLLYGKSGIGKSSILNAGILPAARRNGFVPVIVRLSHKGDTSYLKQIANNIVNSVTPPLEIREVVACKDIEFESLYEFFHRNMFFTANGERVKLLVIFDQFEEIFTLQNDEAVKKRFFAELADLLNDIMPANLQQSTEAHIEESQQATLESSDDFDALFNDIELGDKNDVLDYVTDNEIHLVFTIREDFLSEFEYYTASIPSLKQNRYGLRPINEEQAAQIILRPMPGLISEPVAKLIIEKVTGRKDFELDGVPEIEVDSAVLSLYLNRLYEAKAEEKITSELVEQKGGEIIADFYIDAISDISDSTIEYLEDMLLNGKGRRDNITVFDAIHDGGTTEQELDILCNKKKILRQFNYAGDLRIEYVHDILCPVVKNHKEDRINRRQQEEERIRLEEEKKKLLLEEKAKREKIEKEAEAEKARLRAEAIKTRKRNRRRLYAISSFVLILLLGILGYIWRYEWEHESYYAQFERVNGWPVGVGDELQPEEMKQLPLYYKLSHKGRKGYDTDVEVCSSNDSLPQYARVKVFEVNENDVSDVKAMSYYGLLSKIAKIHFVEGEKNKIDKEVAMDNKGEILFVISYFHLSNGKEAWAQFVTPTGQALQIRDNEIDRMKLSWYYNESDENDLNNGRIESLMYFDASGVCRPAANNTCGYFMKFIDAHTTMRFFMDEYGRTTQTPYNVVMTKSSKDSLEISYLKAISSLDTSPQKAYGPKGYYRELTVGNVTYLYTDTDNHVATLTTKTDKKGNITEEKTAGLQPVPYPAVIEYSYSPKTGYLTDVKKSDSNNKPFITPTDSVYKKHLEYSDDGELILEEHWGLNGKVFSHKISEKEDVRKDELIDKRKGIYITRIDSIQKDGIVISYYGAHHQPIKHTEIEKEDTLVYHKVVVKKYKDIKYKYYYTTNEENGVIPCPVVYNADGKAISYFCKEEKFDTDDNPLYYKLFDANGNVVKSMMRYYQNGQSVARAAMGIEGYGHPVRCPKWEEEGFAYYKIYYSKDFEDHYISIDAVDEWGKPGIFYDPCSDAYKTIVYKDYKGAELVFKGIKTNMLYSYKQYALVKADNISDLSLPYLHILSKESSLYQSGLHDGDRIIEVGSWRVGMSDQLLRREWERMYKEYITISVLHPMASTYEKRTRKITNAKRNCEEYHIYRLTKQEQEVYNNYNRKNQ